MSNAQMVPAFTPDPFTLAEVELRLAGIGNPAMSLHIPDDLRDAALAAGQVTITDPEGALVAAIDLEVHTGLDASTALTGTVAELIADPLDDHVRGMFPTLRLTPKEIGFDGASAIVSHDPVDTATLMAATADVHAPILFIVLDGPRTIPGPGVAEVVPSILTIQDQLQRRARIAEIVVVPAPQYGDARDADLADTIAAAYGARRIVPSDRPDRAALHAWLDGTATEPRADWPEPSLAAWRRWRPVRAKRGLVLFFTGLSGSGKSTVARAVNDVLTEQGVRKTTLLDGDVVRRNLSVGLGFSREDRDRNIERIGYVAAEIARHGGVAICAPIAPFAATRARVRHLAEAHGDFVLVHVATPLEECERRDRKGLYAQARAGKIADFTGISSPYEAPDDADLVLDTSKMTVDEARDQVIDLLRAGGWLGRWSGLDYSASPQGHRHGHGHGHGH